MSSGRSEEELGPRRRYLRVMHVMNRLSRGGTELVTLKVISGLTGGRIRHRLCTLRGFDPSVKLPASMQDRIHCVSSRTSGRQFLIWKLARLMRKFRPHIVHSRNWGAIEAIPAARLANVPISIHSEHGYELPMLDGMPGYRRVLRRAFYSMTDALFTVTRELQSYHARQAWLPPERFRVIYNGVDTFGFAPRPEIRARLRAEFDLAPESFVVGTAGRMVPIKDTQTLIRAAEQVAIGGIDIYVLLMGSGPELVRQQQYVKSCPALEGRVIFLGATDRVPELLNALDAYVLTSMREGMSNTLLEAMACGLPVIATRVGGNPEVVQENETGFLFTPGDTRDLVSHLRMFASQAALRSEFGAAARQRAVRYFAIERMLEEYRHLYMELAERRGLLLKR